jgi:hypothetical protein
MDAMQRTSSSKSEVATWDGNEDALNLAAGNTLTITVPGDFRLLRIGIHFSAPVAPTVTIDQDNPIGANWDQNILTYTPPGAINDLMFIGGIGYEFSQGNDIRITFTAVAAIAYISWTMEQV